MESIIVLSIEVGADDVWRSVELCDDRVELDIATGASHPAARSTIPWCNGIDWSSLASLGTPDDRLAELRRRTRAMQWSEKKTVTDESYGVPLATMRELARHRGSDHVWLEAEARLNARPRVVSELATYVVENGKPLITLIK